MKTCFHILVYDILRNIFRLRPRKSKPDAETPPKDSSKKKVDLKAAQSKDTATELELSVPCRIPFTGMFPAKDDEKVSFPNNIRVTNDFM